MELLLIRHALPIRIEGAEGAADPPLADLGRKQADALAEHLVDEGIEALATSPMRRALETVAPVAARLGIEPLVVPGLSEYDAGSNWYIPIEELRAAGDPRWRSYLDEHWGTDATDDPTGFRATVIASVEELIAAHPGTKVAAVAHGGVLNAYVAHVLQTPMPGVFEPAYTSITRILASRDGHRMIKSVNEASHVRGLLPPGSR